MDAVLLLRQWSGHWLGLASWAYRGDSSLVLVGMYHCEFDSGHIQFLKINPFI